MGVYISIENTKRADEVKLCIYSLLKTPYVHSLKFYFDKRRIAEKQKLRSED
jgi:hypothetical protein